MKIYIIGSGKLANAILLAGLPIESCEVEKWQPTGNSNERSILVHAGSGRELKTCFDFCSKTGSVLIELSTGLETETMVPDFPLIVCPNTSILVLRVLFMLKAMGKTFSDNDISILESHQAGKTSAPGTAHRFAEYLHLPIDKIESVRDPDVQSKRLGIKKEYLDKHAFHRIVIRDGLDEFTLETKVYGHESYSAGVKKIIEAVQKTPLQKKRYTVLDLMDSGWL
jgi:4-hydroxy-tetrahydrodipicolinate reductase